MTVLMYRVFRVYSIYIVDMYFQYSIEYIYIK